MDFLDRAAAQAAEAAQYAKAVEKKYLWGRTPKGGEYLTLKSAQDRATATRERLFTQRAELVDALAALLPPGA